MKWPWSRRTIVVLGTELAAARKAEESRLASGISSPSPLRVDGYDYEHGDYDLVAVSPLPTDLDLQAFANDYRELNPAERHEIKQSLSFDDLYTIIHFVKRSAVLALNRDSTEWCRAGFTALSMIDQTRVDPRDAWWAAGLLRHAINTFPVICDELSQEVAQGRLSDVAGLLEKPAEPFKLSDWRYCELRTERGIGLIGHGGAKYEPTFDLTTLAINIAEQLSSERYVAAVEIGTKVPEIWFATGKRDDAYATLGRALGAATIHGTLRKAYCTDQNQQVVGWIVEMPAASDCERLVADVGTAATYDGRFVTGLAVDRLFALLVAGSFQQGVKPYESPATLADIAGQIKELMKRSATIAPRADDMNLPQ